MWCRFLSSLWLCDSLTPKYTQLFNLLLIETLGRTSSKIFVVFWALSTYLLLVCLKLSLLVFALNFECILFIIFHVFNSLFFHYSAYLIIQRCVFSVLIKLFCTICLQNLMYFIVKKDDRKLKVVQFITEKHLFVVYCTGKGWPI